MLPTRDSPRRSRFGSRRLLPGERAPNKLTGISPARPLDQPSRRFPGLTDKRRTLVVRIFPNTESCLRLIPAMCVATHETWLEDNRYLNMTFLAEQKKELLRPAA